MGCDGGDIGESEDGWDGCCGGGGCEEGGGCSWVGERVVGERVAGSLSGSSVR